MENSQRLRIGDLLVNQNFITNAQRINILREQVRCGRPFGELAERLYGLNPLTTERVWAQQYITFNTWIHLDAHASDARLLPMLTRRQAWQFDLIPLSRADGVLTVVTSRRRLPRAVSFAWRQFSEPVYVALAPRLQIHRHLQRHYPWTARSTFNIARAVDKMRSTDPRHNEDAPAAKPVVAMKAPTRQAADLSVKM